MVNQSQDQAEWIKAELNALSLQSRKNREDLKEDLLVLTLQRLKKAKTENIGDPEKGKTSGKEMTSPKTISSKIAEKAFIKKLEADGWMLSRPAPEAFGQILETYVLLNIQYSIIDGKSEGLYGLCIDETGKVELTRYCDNLSSTARQCNAWLVPYWHPAKKYKVTKDGNSFWILIC